MRSKVTSEKRSKPEVYIIESLDPDDEGNGRFEGAIISQVLNFHGKVCKYEYVRTRDAFEAAVRRFGESNYRYLHISCHADREGICTTNQEEIDFDELAKILNPFLSERRLFLSACEMVHADLAAAIIPHSGCYSVVGPNEDVRFSDAAVLWASLYHLLFSDSPLAIKRDKLLDYLVRTSSMFQVDLSYFSKSDTHARGFTRDLLRKGRKLKR